MAQCFVCKKASTSSCARCKGFQYCGRACQKKHWTEGHKQECTPKQNSSGEKGSEKKEQQGPKHCPGCERELTRQGMAGDIDKEVDTATRGFAFLKSSGRVPGHDMRSLQLAFDIATKLVRELHKIRFSSEDATIRLLCPELSKEALQRLASDETPAGFQSLVDTVNLCENCQPLSPDLTRKQEWLEMSFKGCNCIRKDGQGCGHTPSDLRYYPNGDTAEFGGRDRKPASSKNLVCPVWGILRRDILVSFLRWIAVLDSSDAGEKSNAEFQAMRQKMLGALPALSSGDGAAAADPSGLLPADVSGVLPSGAGAANAQQQAQTRGLRFAVGDEVMCWTSTAKPNAENNTAVWTRGKVIQLWWRERGWPAGRLAPYQVLLHGREEGKDKIYVPADEPQMIKRYSELQLQGKVVRLFGLESKAAIAAGLNGAPGVVRAWQTEAECEELAAEGRMRVLICSDYEKLCDFSPPLWDGSSYYNSDDPSCKGHPQASGTHFKSLKLENLALIEAPVPQQFIDAMHDGVSTGAIRVVNQEGATVDTLHAKNGPSALTATAVRAAADGGKYNMPPFRCENCHLPLASASPGGDGGDGGQGAAGGCEGWVAAAEMSEVWVRLFCLGCATVHGAREFEGSMLDRAQAALGPAASEEQFQDQLHSQFNERDMATFVREFVETSYLAPTKATALISRQARLSPSERGFGTARSDEMMRSMTMTALDMNKRRKKPSK
jgi:hypothetical protein